MKSARLMGCLLCAWAAVAAGQTDLLITSFQGNGQVTWSYPTNFGWPSFRVEWASQATGPWDSFSNAAARLDFIPATGAQMSAAVPMFFPDRGASALA